MVSNLLHCCGYFVKNLLSLVQRQSSQSPADRRSCARVGLLTKVELLSSEHRCQCLEEVPEGICTAHESLERGGELTVR